MSGKIWLVTFGEYSDYAVLCACPTKEVADAVVAQGNQAEGHKPDAHGAWEVEDVPLIDGPLTRADVLTMWCEIYNIDTGAVREREYSSVSFAELGDQPRVRGRSTRTYVHVQGTDHEAVRKSYSERKARMLAETLGL